MHVPRVNSPNIFQLRKDKAPFDTQPISVFRPPRITPTFSISTESTRGRNPLELLGLLLLMLPSVFTLYTLLELLAVLLSQTLYNHVISFQPPTIQHQQRINITSPWLIRLSWLLFMRWYFINPTKIFCTDINWSRNTSFFHNSTAINQICYDIIRRIITCL